MIHDLLIPADTKIVMLILDGLGGIRSGKFGATALEAANTPNLDRIAAEGACGRSLPISIGVTPGSGPAHFALFGYNPLAPQNNVGRGAVEVTGVDFDLEKTDVAIRGNFATMNNAGILTDRRAGRIPHEEGIRICKKLNENINEIDGVEVIVMPVREYRFGVVLRGKGLNPDIDETDPQLTGKKPYPPNPRCDEAKYTAEIIAKFIQRSNEILSDEEKANTVLMRGISQKPDIEPFQEKYNLNPAAVAAYPLYRGVAKLCGMKIIDTGFSPAEEFETVRSIYNDGYNFFFIHIKKTDSYGEDGNIEKKKGVIEDAYRVGVDYFFWKNLSGIYLPIGFEYWKNSLGHKRFENRAEFNTKLFSLGIGYLFNITENVYLDSRFSIGTLLGGSFKVRTSNFEFLPRTKSHSAMLGFGFKF